MAHLLYFWEDRSTATRDDVTAAGLGYALGDGLSFGECRSTGPGGRGGICLCRTAERFGFYPERQQWRKILNDKGLGLWVGYWLESPPAPEELERPKLLPGFPVTLLDGETYQIPAAYEWREHDDRLKWSESLPATADIDAKGEWSRGPVRPEYRRLWEIATNTFDVFYGGGNPADRTIAASDLRAVAAEVLAVNYRLTGIEVALLGLFDDPPNIARQILHATIGKPVIDAYLQKKTAAIVSAGCSGDAGASD